MDTVSSAFSGNETGNTRCRVYRRGFQQSTAVSDLRANPAG